MKERKYPDKKERELNTAEKYLIRGDIASKKFGSFEISKKHGCSHSQVCGIKAAMTKGQ